MTSKNDGIGSAESDKYIVQQSARNIRQDQFRLREMEQQRAFQKEKEQLDNTTKFMNKFKKKFKDAGISLQDYDGIVSRAYSGFSYMQIPEQDRPVPLKPSEVLDSIKGINVKLLEFEKQLHEYLNDECNIELVGNAEDISLLSPTEKYRWDSDEEENKV